MRILKKIGLMKFSIEKKTLIGFGLASTVLVGINVLAYWSFNKHRQTADWTDSIAGQLQPSESCD